MTYQELAMYSNYALYSAMGILTLTMLAYAGYLAGLMPARSERKDVERSEALVGASAGGGAGRGGSVPSAPDRGAPTSLDDGVSMGVETTPTFFLDGEKLTLQRLNDLTDPIDKAIADRGANR